MPLLSVNMAVPIKENIRESQIYFLSSSESVPPENSTVAKKYFIFKTLELILSLCSLMLFAYSMRTTENEIIDMLKYISLGGLTIYPLLYLLLSVSVKRTPILSVIFNASAAATFFLISATTVSAFWIKEPDFLSDRDKEHYSETMMKLRSTVLLSVTGILYSIESLIMCIEIRKSSTDN